VWRQGRFGDRVEQVTPLVIGAGNLGPVLGAPAVGLAVATTSPAAVPSVLAGLTALLIASVALNWWGGWRLERARAGEGTRGG
jgi:predicted Na+-dependent transporter